MGVCKLQVGSTEVEESIIVRPELTRKIRLRSVVYYTKKANGCQRLAGLLSPLL